MNVPGYAMPALLRVRKNVAHIMRLRQGVNSVKTYMPSCTNYSCRRRAARVPETCAVDLFPGITRSLAQRGSTVAF